MRTLATPPGGQNLNRCTVCLVITLAVVSLPYVHAALEPLYVTVYVDVDIDETRILLSIRGHVTGPNQSTVGIVAVTVRVSDPYKNTVHTALVNSDSSGEYSDAFQLLSSRPKGDYEIDVTASKPGFENAYARLVFWVDPTPFSVSISPETAEVGRGETATFRINLEDRGRSSLPVHVDVVGLPQYVSYSLSSNNRTVPSIITMKLETQKETTPGPYIFTAIAKSSEGEASASAEITVTEASSPEQYMLAALLAAAIPLTIVVAYLRSKRKKTISSEMATPESLNGLALSPSTLISLPDHLRKTAILVCQLGEANAVQVAAHSGKTRAAESDYLNQLERMGVLKKKRKGRESYFMPR